MWENTRASLSPSLTHTVSLALSVSLALALTHSHTHTNTHTFSLSHTLIHSLSQDFNALTGDHVLTMWENTCADWLMAAHGAFSQSMVSLTPSIFSNLIRSKS